MKNDIQRHVNFQQYFCVLCVYDQMSYGHIRGVGKIPQVDVGLHHVGLYHVQGVFMSLVVVIIVIIHLYLLILVILQTM